MPKIPRLDRTRASVLVVDVQEKLIPVMWNWAPVEKYLKALIQTAKELDLPLIATEQYPKGLGATIPVLREMLPASPLVKMHFSCGADPEFTKALAATGRRQVIVAGIETHVCVFQTVRELAARGVEVFVPVDGVASRRDDHRAAGLDLCRTAGATLTTMETVVFDWLRRAGTDPFKQLSKLIR